MSGHLSRRSFLLAGAAGITSSAAIAAEAARREARPRTLLAIGAHYDDCVFGIPGALLQAAHNRDRVVILSLIGDYTNWPPVAARSRALVDLSVQMAHAHGMEMRFLPWASMGFEPSLETKRAVAAVLAEVEPDVAFMLWPRDRHPDHEAASAICHAALQQPARLLGRDEIKTPAVTYWYDNGPGHTIGFEPDTYIDVTAEWDRVRDWLGRLMAFVRKEEWDPARPDSATEAKTILARYRGLACGAPYAEALKSMGARRSRRHLIVGEELLQHTRVRVPRKLCRVLSSRMSTNRRSNVMLKTGSSCHRWFLGALVIAVTLPSCGRGADTHPPGNGAAADTAAPAQPVAPAPAPPPAPPRELNWSGKVDMALWSSARVKAYRAALQQSTPPTLAILRIPRLKLEVPVYDGTTDAVLDLAAGRIEGTALPGTTGNVGIAAHRDGFFRVLKDLKEGDSLLLDTPVAAQQYRVEWIRITTPDDVSVIDPTPGPAVTLVGCYPFYHVGSAPKRFIVRAVPVAGSASSD